MVTPRTVRTIPVGGSAITSYLRYLLVHSSARIVDGNGTLVVTMRDLPSHEPALADIPPPSAWPEALLEDIKVRACFVSSCPALLNAPAADVDGHETTAVGEGNMTRTPNLLYRLPWSEACADRRQLFLLVSGWIRAMAAEVLWLSEDRRCLWVEKPMDVADIRCDGSVHRPDSDNSLFPHVLLDRMDDSQSLPEAVLLLLKKVLEWVKSGLKAFPFTLAL